MEPPSIHGVVQSLAADSTLLMGILYSIPPEQQSQFVDLFANVLLRGSETNVRATSEVLAELLMLELDNAAWLHRDLFLFMRGRTIVTDLIETIAKRTITAPDGLLVGQLVQMCQALYENPVSPGVGDGASNSPSSTANETNRPQFSPGGWTDDGTATDAFNRFSTSELQGLASAEQQFLTELDRASPGLASSAAGVPLTSLVATLGDDSDLSFSDVARPVADLSAPLPDLVSSLSPQSTGNLLRRQNGSIASNGGSRRGHNVLSPHSAQGRGIDAAAASVPLPDVLLRTGLDHFASVCLFAPTEEPGASGPSGTPMDCGYLATDASAGCPSQAFIPAIHTFLDDILDLLTETVVSWPEALRRAFWLWLQALNLQSIPLGESQSRLPEEPVASLNSKNYPIKYSVMATVVTLRILSPVLVSMPSFILPVEEDILGPAFLATRKRVTMVTKLLQKAASGQLFDEHRERSNAVLNDMLQALTARWISFFTLLADGESQMSDYWAIPGPPPKQSRCATVADTELVTRLFELLDQSFVQNQHIALLLRPTTEGVHLAQWLRFTEYFYRSKEGRVGVRPASMAVPLTQEMTMACGGTVQRALATSSSSCSVSLADPSTASANSRFLQPSSAGSPQRPASTETSGPGESASNYATDRRSSSRLPSSDEHVRGSLENHRSPGRLLDATEISVQSTVSSGVDRAIVRRVGSSGTADGVAASEPVTVAKAFEEVIAYVRETLGNMEVSNAKPTGGASKSYHTASPQQNFCSIVGMAEDGATTVMVYGDLLYCYLARFYANEKENAEAWCHGCPHFFAYRARVQRASNREIYRDGDAVAHLYFILSLAVAHNVRSNRFYIVFLHDGGHGNYSLGLSWLQDVLALMPLHHLHCCQLIVYVKPKLTGMPHFSSLYRSARGNYSSSGSSNTLSNGASGVRYAPPVVRVTQVQELPKALSFIVTYLPLPLFEYQLLMKERKKERSQTAVNPSLALPRCAHEGRSAAVAADRIEEEQRRWAQLPPVRRYLHERWARPLHICPALRTAGIWMLQCSHGFFEVLCTATCRRDYTTGELRPMVGVAPEAFTRLAAFVVESFVSLTGTSLLYLGQEPKWLRESAMVTNGTVTTATSDVQVQLPSDVKLKSPEDERRLHCSWLFLGRDKMKDRERQQFEAAVQRLVFISSEVDSAEEGRSWDQIVSTRWALDIYRRETKGGIFVDGSGAAVSSRFVPSLRQVPLRTVWRLVMYNVQQMCAIMRANTPSVCPFIRIAVAVEKIRVNLRTGDAQGSGAETRPPEQSSTEWKHAGSLCDGVVLSVAGKTLAACHDAEIGVTRLIVAMCAYVRNIHNTQLLSKKRVEAMSLEKLNEGLMSGMGHLLYSREPSSLGERRVVEMFACHGEELMKRAKLPSYESCSWNPYSRLWYST